MLELFVEILTPEQAKSRPVVDVSPPPPQAWELRVVAWRLKEGPLDVDASGLADWCAHAPL
eukprot:1565050-Prymnesium_polylepis.1